MVINLIGETYNKVPKGYNDARMVLIEVEITAAKY